MIFSVFYILSVPSLVLQMKVSLDSLMDSLTSLPDTGDCVARDEHLLKDLKKLEEKALVSQQTHTHTHTATYRLEERERAYRRRIALWLARRNTCPVCFHCHSKRRLTAAMRNDVLAKLHEGHQGVEKCRSHARQFVAWTQSASELYGAQQSMHTRAEKIQRATHAIRTPWKTKRKQKLGADLSPTWSIWYDKCNCRKLTPSYSRLHIKYGKNSWFLRPP